MLGIFCYVKDEINVVLPFYVIGIKLSDEIKEDVITFLNFYDNLTNLKVNQTYTLLYKFTQIFKNNYKFYYQELGKFEVEKYGLASAYYRSVRYLSNFDDQVIVSNCNSKLNDFCKKVTYVDNFIDYPELTLGYLYSNYLREINILRYNAWYPHLLLNKNKGKLDSKHLEIVLNLKRLPYFYNESLLLEIILKDNLTPTWAESYIQNHYDHTFR